MVDGTSRTLSRRRLVIGAGAAAVVLAGGGGAAWWAVRRSGGTPVLPPGMGTDGMGTTGRRTSGQGQRHLAFTWLPPGYADQGWNLDAQWESADAAATPDAAQWTRVAAYRSGLTPPRVPEDDLGAHWSTADGDKRVNGRPTQWMALTGIDGVRNTRLRWNYTVDSWATIDHRSREADGFATAHRIASGLRFDATTAVRLPVVATGLPGQLRLQAIGGTDSGAKWLFDLWYGAQPRPLTGGGDGLGVTVTPMDSEQRTLALIGATTKVDGYPARYSPSSKNGPYVDSLSVWDINGCHLAIGISGKSLFDLFGSAGATGALAHLQVTADRSRWS